jgi:hypothetical protein
MAHHHPIFLLPLTSFDLGAHLSITHHIQTAHHRLLIVIPPPCPLPMPMTTGTMSLQGQILTKKHADDDGVVMTNRKYPGQWYVLIEKITNTNSNVKTKGASRVQKFRFAPYLRHA